MRVLRGDLGPVVRWGHLHDVHCHHVRAQNHLADCPQEVGGSHAAGFRGPGAGREPRVEHVYIDR